MYVYMRVCAHIYMYVRACMNVYVYVRICTCTYASTKGVQHIRIFRGKMTSHANFFLVFVEMVILIVDT